MEKISKRRAQERERKIQSERLEMERARQALLKDQEKALRRKQQMKAKMDAMVQDNKNNMLMKELRKQQEAEMDKLVAKTMMQRLEKEERARALALQKMIDQQNLAEQRTRPLLEQLSKKTKDEEKKIAQSMKESEEAQEKDRQLREARRAKLAEDQVRFLKEHHAEVERRKKKEKDEELRVARQILQEDKEAVQKDKREKIGKRMQNMNHRRELEQQIMQNMRMKQANLVCVMSDTEAKFNRQLINSAET
uniref:Uncharacterized protein n=1 Tax=Fibrocapsa japonica TaxID=94617 RepID=A0A7S2UYP2_9STRA